MSSLAIITARGGSKRIPGKNIRPFLGKPALAWPIEAALKSSCFSEVMVSTDDEAIAAVARQYGADVPFMRSSETANDHATLADVVKEVLNRYAEQGKTFDNVCCLLATAFSITPESLQEACKLLEKPSADGVMPVVRFGFPIQRALWMNEQHEVGFMQPEHRLTRSQDLAPAYHDSGQFYLLKTEAFARQGRIIADRMHAVELPWYAAVDIDEESDWQRAEALLSHLHKQS